MTPRKKKDKPIPVKDKKAEQKLDGLRKIEEEALEVLEEIRDEFHPGHPHKHRLVAIRIEFSKPHPGDTSHMPTQGAVTLNVGQTSKATILGFQADGSPFQGTIPPVSFSIDHPQIASETPDSSNGADVLGLSPGLTNLTANLTTAEGLALTANGTVTVTGGATGVLASIQIQFSDPAVAGAPAPTPPPTTTPAPTPTPAPANP